MGKQSHQGQIYCSVETKSHHQTSEKEKYDAAGLRGTGAEMIGLHNICLYQSEEEIEDRGTGEARWREGEAGEGKREDVRRSSCIGCLVHLFQYLSFTLCFSLSSFFFPLPFIFLPPFFCFLFPCAYIYMPHHPLISGGPGRPGISSFFICILIQFMTFFFLFPCRRT